LTGAAGVVRLTENESLFSSLESLWQSTTQRKMYITGGLGSNSEWEGFGPDYFLPNESGYLETCAAVGLVLFAHQMLLINPRNVEYANTLELALYNAVLVGISLDGKRFFYDNPLATIDAFHTRREWFDVSCCPANAARLIASMGKYIYTVDEENAVYAHLYLSSTASLTLQNGRVVTVTQESYGPWKGGAYFTVKDESGHFGPLSLCLRIPPGSKDFSVSSSNAQLSILRVSRTHAVLFIKNLRTLTFDVKFSFAPRRLQPHALNLDNRHCVAFARGPFIYCAETTDNDDSFGDLRGVRIPDDAEIHEEELDEVGLEELGFGADERIGLGLATGSYPIILSISAKAVQQPSLGATRTLKLIPYFMWANRGPSSLRVWLARA